MVYFEVSRAGFVCHDPSVSDSRRSSVSPQRAALTSAAAQTQGAISSLSLGSLCCHDVLVSRKRQEINCFLGHARRKLSVAVVSQFEISSESGRGGCPACWGVSSPLSMASSRHFSASSSQARLSSSRPALDAFAWHCAAHARYSPALLSNTLSPATGPVGPS